MVNEFWRDFPATGVLTQEIELFRKHERAGRPSKRTISMKALNVNRADNSSDNNRGPKIKTKNIPGIPITGSSPGP